MTPTPTITTDTAPSRAAIAHERRVCRILESRGQGGLGEALVKLSGLTISSRIRLDSLYAAGGEGAVFLCTDLRDPKTPYVGKIPLVPYHRGIDLSSNYLRRRRENLREEARNLEASASRFMPVSHGMWEFTNPLLDPSRGGEFTEREPLLLMERMPGFDLDLWLARVHRSDIPVALLRRNLDRVAVVLLTALVDLQEHGFYYADLRPGNLRMMGRPERRVRLLDAGSLVEIGDESGKFPHVPAYLPPELFRRKQETGVTIIPNRAIQAVMAGRTLYEAATGKVPVPGQEIDRAALKESNVSQPVADVVDGLATGSFEDVRPALRYLTKRAVKRIVVSPPPAPAPKTMPMGSGDTLVLSPAAAARLAAASVAQSQSQPTTPAAAAAAATEPAPGTAEPAAPRASENVLPAASPRPWWRRVLGLK